MDISVAAQLRALRDYAKNNGYSVAREYVDEAESSFSFDGHNSNGKLRYSWSVELGG